MIFCCFTLNIVMYVQKIKDQMGDPVLVTLGDFLDMPFYNNALSQKKSTCQLADGFIDVSGGIRSEGV